ncbi:2-dehydro-3-deoxygalactonokinase [Bremerella sp. JC770]|uniref:2-dehydro-3-deoxygalactonokinase n=1 Tax=Bremerella sp. JC770 TaxID=3232137 RepID=UPI0034591745
MYSHFLNCDWGTTNFRLRLVEVASQKIVAQRSSPDGASSLAGASSDATRPRYFQNVLLRHVQALSQTTSIDVETLPIVISGMASSSMGWKDLPYAETPLAIDGHQLVLSRLSDVGELTQPVYLISGVRSESDVMRGEETELVGLGTLHHELFARHATTWVLLPGTHCKHVFVQRGTIVDFHTYMTGELFQLLSEQSSLRHPELPEKSCCDWSNRQLVDAFCEGVRLAEKDGLTRSLFQVRVGQLRNGLTSAASQALLSGQLIGSEIWSLKSQSASDAHIVLCAGRKLSVPYRMALELAGMAHRTTEISVEEVERLSAAGQWQALNLCRQRAEEHGQAMHRPMRPSIAAASKSNLL